MRELLRNRANLALLVSLCFSLALIIARFLFTGSLTYGFLIWNLFLAGIPFAIVTAFKTWNIGSRQFWFWPMMLLWLLFLPNAPYITTDLLHLRHATSTSVWFDSLLTFSFAINGMFLFFLALEPVQAMVARGRSILMTWTFVAIVAGLSAFGVYLGRHLRFNSWDLILAPAILIEEIVDRVADPFAHPRTWAMTAVYAAFLLVTYYMLWTLSRQQAPGHRPPRTA